MTARFVTTVALLLATSLRAGEWVLGADGDKRHTFAYLSRIERKPLHRGAELVFSGTVSYLHYDASDVTVSSPGIGAAVEYRIFGPRFSIAAGPGYEVRFTQRRNATTENEIEQGPVALGNATFLVAQRTWLGGDASYSFANEWLASRAQFKQGISDTLRVGVEIGWSGNRDLRIRSEGGLFEIPAGSENTWLQFRAGTSTSRDRNGSEQSQPYYSVGIARSF
jgi:hypothetical protein